MVHQVAVGHLNLQDAARRMSSEGSVVSGQPTQRTGRVAHLSAVALSARGMLSALSTARRKLHGRRNSTSVTPNLSHLEPAVSMEQAYKWKLLPSQRQQLCELYHQHHEMTDSFWGMYDLVHAANISMSPPALLDALLEVGVNIPQSSDGSRDESTKGGAFLSEFQFLRVVEGIMTDPKYEHSYYEDDKQLVELALDVGDEAHHEDSVNSHSPHEHLLQGVDTTRIELSRLTHVLRQYSLEARQGHMSSDNVLASSHRVAMKSSPSSTPPPAFLVSMLQQDAGVANGLKKHSQRKSIVAPLRVDVPDHVSLEMLCSALNRASLATPDPLTDYRCVGAIATSRGDPPVAGRNRGPSLLSNSHSVRPRAMSTSRSRSVVGALDSTALAFSFATTTSQLSPLVHSGELPVQANDTSVLMAENAAMIGTAVSPDRGKSCSPVGSPKARRQNHKMISSNDAHDLDIPLPPLRKKPGKWERTDPSGGTATLRRQDSLDNLLRTTMESCVEVTRVMEKNLVNQQRRESKASRPSRKATYRVRSGGPLSGSDEEDQVPFSEPEDEENSESSSTSSFGMRSNTCCATKLTADLRCNAYNVVVPDALSRGSLAAVNRCHDARLPPLAPTSRNQHCAGFGEDSLSVHRPTYRKPWLEKPCHGGLAELQKKRSQERKSKESRKVGMETLISEVEALSPAERRALTPCTRRMVAIARSASSLESRVSSTARCDYQPPREPAPDSAVQNCLLDRWTTGGGKNAAFVQKRRR